MEANFQLSRSLTHGTNKFLEFYVKYFVIPPLLNDPQFSLLLSNPVKLCVNFFKRKILTR